MFNSRVILSITFRSLLWLFSILWISSSTGASETIERAKRSYIQSVDGYAYLSEDMTLADIREMAYTNAKRQALKMTSSYVKSKTTVENFVLKEDLLESSAEGIVTVLEEKDFGIQDNNRYHVWIKAEVKFDIESPQEITESDGDRDPGENRSLPEGPLTVEVWTSKKVYAPGENITVFIKGNRDFYARIIDVTVDGDIVQLLPNEFRSDSFFKGGEVYQVPDSDDQFMLKSSPPFGTDRITVYASDNPLGEVDLETTAGGLGLYRGTVEDLAFKTRGISVVDKKTASPDTVSVGAEFFEQSWIITTQSGDSANE